MMGLIEKQKNSMTLMAMRLMRQKAIMTANASTEKPMLVLAHSVNIAVIASSY
jgi:hypothetical protein